MTHYIDLQNYPSTFQCLQTICSMFSQLPLLCTISSHSFHLFHSFHSQGFHTSKASLSFAPGRSGTAKHMNHSAKSSKSEHGKTSGSCCSWISVARLAIHSYTFLLCRRKICRTVLHIQQRHSRDQSWSPLIWIFLVLFSRGSPASPCLVSANMLHRWCGPRSSTQRLKHAGSTTMCCKCRTFWAQNWLIFK